jgi:hypothetical protein
MMVLQVESSTLFVVIPSRRKGDVHDCHLSIERASGFP